MPNKAPFIPEGKDAYESMLIRVAYEDLYSSYPFSMSKPFAPRISLMGEEAIPYVIQAAESNHSFLRQNAVLWLSQSDNGRAHAALRDIFAKTNDPVVRNRCLESFARRRDRGHVELLLKQIKESSDMSYRCYLAYVLGRIGDPRARSVITELLETHKGSFDFSCAALSALSRLGWTDDAAVRKLLATFRNSPPAGDIQSRYQPNTPDPPGTRRQIQKQLAIIAETQVKGDEASRAALMKIVAELRTPTLYLAIEALSTFPEGREVLKKWIEEKETDVTVKAFATAKLAAGVTPDTIEFFKRVATIDSPQPVCEIALRTLETSDRDAAIECARGIVFRAARGLEPGRRYIVSLACRLLVAHKRIAASRIVELIENDLIASEACVLNLNTPDATEFTTQVPAIEQMLIELGELKDPKAMPMLLDILRSPTSRGRAEACVALGKMGGLDAILHLIDFAEDTSDGWVRFVAARVVSEIARREFRCDWINGDPEDRAKAVKKMREWAEGLK
jgi:HEAT repeat protein